MLSRKKSIATRFFRWVIQATDSTLTGWRAKIRAARYAPGIFSRFKIVQSRSASPICIRTLVAWYPAACIPQMRHSTHNVVDVSGQ